MSSCSIAVVYRLPHSQVQAAVFDPGVSIGGSLVLLGTGTSVGVPSLGCGCAVCQSHDPRDRRLRSSAVVGLPAGNLLIDTSPDLRTQLLRERIGVAHAVFYTHEHADHLMGLDDLRLFPFYIGQPVPLYCEEIVEQRIRQSFDYAFRPEPPTHEGAVPKLTFRRILPATEVPILGATVLPLRLQHGPRFQVLGLRIGNVAYCTDTNEIPEASLDLLRNLDVLVIDGLRWRKHVTHFSLPEAIQVAEQLQPRRTIFTHICHELGHEVTNRALPKGMELGYDGLRIPLT